jgi:trans-aconitate methyltransferase
MNNMQSSDQPVAPENAWDPALYDDRHSFVWKRGAGVVELLAPQPGEHILDLGCGTGHLTAQIAASGAIVTGVDSAPSMIEQARHNYPQLQFELADAAALEFNATFDVVFSNAAIHWMKNQPQVVDNIGRALKPGGRFVAEFGGKGNIQRIATAAFDALRADGYPEPEKLSPWYYPSIGEYASLLEQHQLLVTYAILFDRPTPLEGGDEGMRNWLQMFSPMILSVVPDERRQALIRDIERRLRPTLYRNGAWTADYRRLRVVALKEDRTRRYEPRNSEAPEGI